MYLRLKEICKGVRGFSVFLATFSVAFGQAAWKQLGSDIDGEAAHDGAGYSVSLSADGSVVAIGAPNNDGNGDNSGSVRIYHWNESAWQQRGLDIDGEFEKDRSGISISLNSDGSVVAIGADFNDGNGDRSGHVRIYHWNGSEWLQRGLDINGEAAGNMSGSSVSLSSDGSVVAIGTPGFVNDKDPGYVRIYDWDDVKWQQRGSAIEGENDGDHSGSNVSLSSNGSIVAISAVANSDNGLSSGHVRIYQWNGNQWIQLGSDIDGEAEEDASGEGLSLSADGSVVAIGAPNNDGNGPATGHVRVYRWDSNQWVQQGSDIDGENSVGDGDSSGRSVSLSSDGSIVAIGAPVNNDNGERAGHVRVFQWDGSEWLQLGLDIDGEAETDMSGWSVALSSNGFKLAVGARDNSGGGLFSGHVRIYEWYDPSPPEIVLDEYYEALSGASVNINAKPLKSEPDGYSYQWHINGFAIPPAFGGQSESFTIDGNESNNGTWRVEVTGAGGTTSHEFEFRVFVDSDEDGLSDYRESNILLTDSSLSDSDGDGLSDGAEVNTYGTNPLKVDSNDDGVGDGLAVQFGLDPSRDLSAFSNQVLAKLKDIRIKSNIAAVTDTEAKLQFVIEESDDLTSWSERETVDVTIPIQEGEKTKYLRFKVKE